MARSSITGLTLVGALCCSLTAHAGPPVLVAASDPTRIEAVDLAKVGVKDGSAWLRVRLNAAARLAIVTEATAAEPARRASDWLGALDFVTRQRIAPPAGPLPDCGEASELRLADSGLPEPALLHESLGASLGSEVELRRLLAEQGVAVDPVTLARFTAEARPPFRAAFYRSVSERAVSGTLRFSTPGPALELPHVVAVGQGAVPVNLILLSTLALVPDVAVAVDPSELSVSYRGGSMTTDYAEVRASYLIEHPSAWLGEARATNALFDWTGFPNGESLAPALGRYFQSLPYARALACQQQLEEARAHASELGTDYTCEGFDDLSRALGELDFREPRLSRVFGQLGEEPLPLTLAAKSPRDPRLEASDFDARDCPTPVIVPPGSVPVPVPPSPEPPVSSGGTGPVYYEPEPPLPSYAGSQGSCNLVIVGSDDSCGSRSPEPRDSSDTCSGDTTSEDTSESCSGDTSSDDAPESCSGDSSSDDDSAGCGQSEYDGDTCAGDTADDAHASSRAAKPRRVRLSLLTFLLAALALPLRRRAGFR